MPKGTRVWQSASAMPVKHEKGRVKIMVLKELLEQFKGRIVKIGTGCGFIYCDTSSGQTYAELEDMGKEVFREMKKRKADLEEKLSDYENFWNNLVQSREAAFKRRCVQSCYTPSMVTNLHYRLEKQLEKDKVKIKKDWEKEVEHLALSIEGFTPFVEREVREYYRSFTEPDMFNPNGMIIIIEGEERGKYWTSEEYINRDRLQKSVDDDDNDKNDAEEDFVYYFNGAG